MGVEKVNKISAAEEEHLEERAETSYHLTLR